MKIITVANQKGGVGKTTTALNLGVALRNKGNEVLLIDLDPQANLSSYLGFEKESGYTIDYLIDQFQKKQLVPEMIQIQRNDREGVDYLPSSIKLSSAEVTLINAVSRERILTRFLKLEPFEEYDYIIIDCSPSLGVMLLNALAAADYLLIPVQMQKFSLDGLNDLFGVYEMVKEEINPGLQLLGMVQTMMDRTTIAKEIKGALDERFADVVFKQSISRRVEATESTAYQESLVNKTNSQLGEEYSRLADEIAERIG